MFSPTPGYLAELRSLTERYDILLVADEVITGFGRTGAWFACDRWDIEPDMITMAKGLTSGYLPLGAVAISPRIGEPFATGPDAPMFRHGLTYSGHATACAVASVNLDILEEENLVETVRTLEPVLETAVKALDDSPVVHEVRSVGLLAGIQLVPQIDGGAVVRGLRDRGVLTRLITDNTLHVCPPFVVTATELETAIASICDHLATLEGSL